MAAPVKRATLDDLMRTEGKAELIAGRIVQYMPTGDRPNEIACNIFVRLREHARTTRQGRARMDNLGYAVAELPSGRETFSPDTSFYVGPRPTNRMGFVEGPPTFAVEIRSENDYGPAAEAEMAAKREDYFQAGTLVVWDVDPLAETITCYRPGESVPRVFRRGDSADAEPAVPAWRVPVDEVFAED